MNRTLVLVASALLLALGAGVVGPLQAARPPRPPPPVFESRGPSAVHAGALTLEGQLSGPLLLAGRSEAYAVLTVRTDPMPRPLRQPVNLALVIDRSGSMRGQKLSDARQAARLLVERLGPEDRLALVHYGSDVAVMNSTYVTPEARGRLRTFLQGLEDEGATNLSAGLEAGAQALRPYVRDFGVSRLILLSDGAPTDGIVDERQLGGMAEDYRREGITVSGLGVGEDFNETLMRGLAEQGGGFYGYIQDSERLADILQRELDQATGTMASGVELRLSLPEGVEAEALGVPGRSEPHALVVPIYDLAGGQEVRVVVRLTLDLEATLTEREVLGVALHYRQPESRGEDRMSLSLRAQMVSSMQRVKPALSPQVKVAVAQALGARELRDAAEAMKQGERERALVMLGKARSLFGSAPAELAGELEEAERSQAAYLNAPDETSVRRESLKLHTRSLRSFGQGNSY